MLISTKELNLVLLFWLKDFYVQFWIWCVPDKSVAEPEFLLEFSPESITSSLFSFKLLEVDLHQHYRNFVPLCKLRSCTLKYLYRSCSPKGLKYSATRARLCSSSCLRDSSFYHRRLEFHFPGHFANPGSTLRSKGSKIFCRDLSRGELSNLCFWCTENSSHRRTTLLRYSHTHEIWKPHLLRDIINKTWYVRAHWAFAPIILLLALFVHILHRYRSCHSAPKTNYHYFLFWCVWGFIKIALEWQVWQIRAH